MLPKDHQNLVINVSVVVDEKVNKLGNEDLLLAEGSRKGGDSGGIISLRIGRVCRLIEALSRRKLNSECVHEVSCLLDSASSSINYRSSSFCVAGERGYDSEELLNLVNICKHLPRRLNGCENYHIHLETVVPGEEVEEVRVVIKL